VNIEPYISRKRLLYRVATPAYGALALNVYEPDFLDIGANSGYYTALSGLRRFPLP
jgi:hypothetical protein